MNLVNGTGEVVSNRELIQERALGFDAGGERIRLVLLSDRL
jgi:hypothetical protein